ncbi:MAG: phosphatase PAP2 family protein [Pseudomonadota bacterium]
MTRAIHILALALPVLAPLTAGAPARAGGFETYGNIFAYAIPAAAGAITLAKGDEKGLWQLGSSYALANGTTWALKQTIDSTRPNGKPESFPSGHTTSAFAGASYLHYRYGLDYGLPAYGLAALVGVSRVTSNNHRWRDVVAGAAIANVSAYFLVDRFKAPPPVNIVVGERGFYGVTAAFRF